MNKYGICKTYLYSRCLLGVHNLYTYVYYVLYAYIYIYIYICAHMLHIYIYIYHIHNLTMVCMNHLLRPLHPSIWPLSFRAEPRPRVEASAAPSSDRAATRPQTRRIGTSSCDLPFETHAKNNTHKGDTKTTLFGPLKKKDTPKKGNPKAKTHPKRAAPKKRQTHV